MKQTTITMDDWRGKALLVAATLAVMLLYAVCVYVLGFPPIFFT